MAVNVKINNVFLLSIETLKDTSCMQAVTTDVYCYTYALRNVSVSLNNSSRNIVEYFSNTKRYPIRPEHNIEKYAFTHTVLHCILLKLCYFLVKLLSELNAKKNLLAVSHVLSLHSSCRFLYGHRRCIAASSADTSDSCRCICSSRRTSNRHNLRCFISAHRFSGFLIK